MASNASTSLLSLTGSVDDILLSYVSVGEGGAQAVLNLRKVCSTTKLWVDTLLPEESKRIFSRRQAKVEVRVESVQEFLAAPPPSGVTGLTGVTSLCLKETDALSHHRFPPENEELWHRFVSFWTPKLESLEIDVLCLPLNSKLGQLLSLESLRSLRCHTIKQNEERPTVGTGLSENLFRFEELQMGHLDMGASQKREFLSRLSTHQNLKTLDVKIEDKEGLNGIVDLVERKKSVADFKMSLTVDPEQIERVDGDNDEREVERLEALYARLATSVVNSSASIRIRGLREEEVLVVYRQVDPETARKFFKSVVEISFYFFTQYALDLDLRVRATDFPNLETYALTSDYDDYEYLETLEATAFPPTLKKLQMEQGLPRPASLPSTLTHLEIRDYICPTNELLHGLFSLAEECPSLRNLKLSWDYCYKSKAEGDSSSGFQSFATSPKFKDLKSLDFGARHSEEGEVAVHRMILFHGFKLPQLSLCDLKLAFSGPCRVVDHSILVALDSGPMSESLLNVNIDPRFVAKYAHPFLDLLHSTAAGNKRKRAETHGKERERQFNREWESRNKLKPIGRKRRLRFWN